MADEMTLTEYEKLSMAEVCNVSDGHARQTQTHTQSEIVQRLHSLFLTAETTPQTEFESQFKSDFFSLASQPSILKDLGRILLCHSSSSAIEIIANYLRQRKYSVSLIEPTFDNIPRILSRHNIPLRSFLDDNFPPPDIDAFVRDLATDALFLVCPNNPTGSVLDQVQFSALATSCRKYHKMLIIDVCFRLYSKEMLWDQYEILDELGGEYALIEDTGKTWPTVDLKVGMLITNKGIAADIALIHDDYLLNVSPFTLGLLSAYIADTKAVGLYPSVLQVCQENREYLLTLCSDTCLQNATRTHVNLVWLRIGSTFTGEDLYRELVKANVHILPGTNFFWSNPQFGAHFCRIALSRTHHSFKYAADHLRKVAIDLDKQTL